MLSLTYSSTEIQKKLKKMTKPPKNWLDHPKSVLLFKKCVFFYNLTKTLIFFFWVIQVDDNFRLSNEIIRQPEVFSNDLVSGQGDGQTARWAEEVSMASQNVSNFGGNSDNWASQVN